MRFASSISLQQDLRVPKTPLVFAAHFPERRDLERQPANPIRRIAYLRALLGVETSRAVYQRITHGRFPPPDLNDGRNGWLDSTVRAWEASERATVHKRQTALTAA